MTTSAAHDVGMRPDGGQQIIEESGSVMDGVDEPMSRTGIRWSEAEEKRLLEAVRAGTPIDTLTAEFGRTTGALNSRVRPWLPYGNAAKHDGDAITALHQVLVDDPDYRPPLSIREQMRQQRKQQDQARSRAAAAQAIDHSAAHTLPGNPHADVAQFVDDLSYPAAALREALLAVAFELRTANLIAATTTEKGRLDPAVEQRLGNQDPNR